MSTKDSKRFDHLWRETVVVAYGKLNTHARLTVHHAAEFRRAAYRFASGVLQMQKHHHNELVAMIESEGKTVNQWMDEHFEIIEAMDDTRERIYAAIEAGDTEREYVESAKIAIARKRVKAKDIAVKDDGVIPQPSTRAMTPEEKAEEYRDLYESMKSKYQGLRRQLHEAREDRGRMEVRMRKMERVIRRLKKDIEALHIGQVLGASKV